MQKDNLFICNWNYLVLLSKNLAKQISKDGRPDLVIGITRGGCCVATIISEMIRRNMITVCSTRRKNDIEINKHPVLITKIDKELVKNKKILIVDEIVVTGETINIVKEALNNIGVKETKTCVIANRSNGKYKCDYTGIYSDKNNIVFPWDYLVMDENDNFIVHPEYKNISNELGVDLFGM